MILESRVLTLVHVGYLFGCISLSTNSLHAPLAPFTVLRLQPFKRDFTTVLLQEPGVQRGWH